MSKTIINISTLNINLSINGQPQAPGLLAGLIAGYLQGGDEGSEFDRPVATEGTATGEPQAEAQPEATADTVLAFLNSNPEYKLRTGKAIFEAFPGTDLDTLQSILTALVDGGKVEVKQRRSDGVQLYKALVQAPASAAPQAQGDAHASVEDQIVAFIGGNPKFSKRSATAIAKAFPNVTDINDVLDKLVDDGKLDYIQGRSDSMYSVAPADEPRNVQVGETVTPEAIAEYIDESEYTLLSADALARHFNGVSREDLQRTLDEGVEDDVLYTRRRRIDGVTLYGAN